MAKRNQQSSTQGVRGKNPVIAGLLAWMIPGMGHFYLRRRIHGIIFLVTINLLFFLGCSLGGDLFPKIQDAGAIGVLSRISHFFNGLPFIGTWQIWGETARPAAPYSEMGKAWIDIACLLNILIIFNAYDIAKGRPIFSNKTDGDGNQAKS